ncbi:MAG: phosphoribosylformylglycinamidine synthase subunit PurL [Gammaproteobacteria bacterium]|nr:phosphoribosylformylglycinamidine synthase subunit PurL [Gammaproteobacteria bacterium]
MPIQNDSFDFHTMTESERLACLKHYQIALTPDEALKIQSLLQRPPTLSECILWGIQGSEHCSYKSSRMHLKTLITDGPNVISGAKEDAGIVAIARDKQGHRYGLVVSHESHNHPSQIVPFEGAATGIGGNVRDVCCMGATVIANADGLRFGDINLHKTHWIHQGVVSGIASYSNAIGVPNLAGDVYYNEHYNDNCLVTVVSLGIIREDHITHSYAPKNAEGYDLILVGKLTDNSGFGGASFASIDLKEEDKAQNRSAVQEPNAFLGRMILQSSYNLFKKLIALDRIKDVGFKDLGAGGIACASVELAEAGGYGAEVNLDNVHVGLEGLHPSVILCAETQERYMWVSPPDLTALIIKHYNEDFDLPKISEGARASVIGKITEDGRYKVSYRGQTLIDAKAEDITKGIVYERPMQAPIKGLHEPQFPTADCADTLLALLAHENIASQKPIYENYDKQVQGRTIIERGQADAGVMQPFNSQDFPEEIRQTGIALSLSANPRFGLIDPYWAAANAVVEAMMNVAAVGATPQAITDCLCFGNPEKPEQMWEVVEAINGIKAACEAIHLKEYPDAATPIIAGNVSLYNESKAGPIPASPMISCVGKLIDASTAISSDFKQTGSLVMVVGERKNECGGSLWYDLHKALGATLPKPDFTEIQNQIYALTEAIDKRVVLAAKTINRGGLAVAVAKMSLGNFIGVEVHLKAANVEQALFSESPGFLLEVSELNLEHLTEIFNRYKLSFEIIGKTMQKGIIQINDCGVNIEQAYQAWSSGLRDKL